MKPVKQIECVDKDVLMDSLLTQFLSLVRLGILNHAKENANKEIVEVLERETKIGLQIWSNSTYGEMYVDREDSEWVYTRVYYIHINSYSFIRKKSKCLDVLTKGMNLKEYLGTKYFFTITNELEIVSSMLNLLSYVKLNNNEKAYKAFEQGLTTILDTGDLND